MQSARIDIFFSCSFHEEDKEVNGYFLSICSALDLKCINVDGAYTAVPPDVARKQIDEAQGFIAIATKRTKLEGGDYAMPSAVQEELSMAYGKDMPILFFVEDGVSIEGMAQNFGTYMKFSRENIYKKESLEKIIRSIHTLKLEIISPNDLIYEHDTPEVIADYVKTLTELRKTETGYTWTYTVTKKLQFLSAFKKHIPVAFRATVPTKIPEGEENTGIEITLESHSRDLSLNIETIKAAPDDMKSLLKIQPYPDKGDFIEYSTYAESKYFNPVYFEDLRENISVEVDGITYRCIDGFIPTQRTKKAIIEFRFPRGFGLKKKDIVFFVGSYTDGIDYIVESEITRSTLEVNEIGGSLTLRILAENPLPRYMYGFAWNPPHENGEKGSGSH